MADASLPRMPRNLLPPLVDSYRVKPVLQQAVTPFEVGAPRRRNLTRRPDYEVPVTWRFTRAEYVFWTVFYQGDADFGAAWVVIPLAGPLGMFDAECQIVEAPEDAPQGCMAAWTTTARLLCRNWPRPSKRDAYAQLPGIRARMQQFDIDINRTIGHAG